MTAAPGQPPTVNENPSATRTERGTAGGTAAPPHLLKPRRGLFVLLLLVWAGWIGVLLWVYFHDVAPSPLQPNPATVPATLRALAGR